MISMPDVDMGNISMPTNDATPDDAGPARSSSEEKDNLTPQQSRRKAQNRAA